MIALPIIILAGVYDYKFRIIPNYIVLILLLIGFGSSVHIIERIAGFLIPAFPLFFIGT